MAKNLLGQQRKDAERVLQKQVIPWPKPERQQDYLVQDGRHYSLLVCSCRGDPLRHGSCVVCMAIRDHGNSHACDCG